MGKIKVIKEPKGSVATKKSVSKPEPRVRAKAVSKPAATKATGKTAPKKLPESVSVAKPARGGKGKRIAMFVDLENTGIRAHNLMEVLSHLRGIGEIVFGKVYGLTDALVHEFEELVAENRLESIGKMRFSPGSVSVVDTRLVVDAIRLSAQHKFDLVFVWAGMGDLSSLFQVLKEMGAKTATVDVPALDTANRFVDTRVKLYSGYTFEKVRISGASFPSGQPSNYYTVAPEIIEDEKADRKREKEEEIPISSRVRAPKAVMPSVDLFAGQDVPQLPRKQGVPSSGGLEPVTMNKPSDDDETGLGGSADGPISVDELPEIFNSLPLDKREEIAKLSLAERTDLELYLQTQEILREIEEENNAMADMAPNLGDDEVATSPKPVIEPIVVPEPANPKPEPAPRRVANVTDDMFDDFGDLGSTPSTS